MSHLRWLLTADESGEGLTTETTFSRIDSDESGEDASLSATRGSEWGSRKAPLSHRLQKRALQKQSKRETYRSKKSGSLGDHGERLAAIENKLAEEWPGPGGMVSVLPQEDVCQMKVDLDRGVGALGVTLMWQVGARFALNCATGVS